MSGLVTEAKIAELVTDGLGLQFGEHDNCKVECGMEAVVRHVIEAVAADIAAEALNAAADDVARVRREGLRPDEQYGPYSESFEQWLRARTEQTHD